VPELHRRRGDPPPRTHRRGHRGGRGPQHRLTASLLPGERQGGVRGAFHVHSLSADGHRPSAPGRDSGPLRGGTSAMSRDVTILIVDRYDATLYALESALAPLGHLLGRATTSQESLKQLLRATVGLVLLNLRTPG